MRRNPTITFAVSSRSAVERRSSRLPALALALLLTPAIACTGVADKPASNAGAGTQDSPFIVRRDNLAFGGEVAVKGHQVSALGANLDPTYLSHSQWSNAQGHVHLEELRANGSRYVDFYSPLLPRDHFQAPGNARFATRAGTLVHGNVYKVTASGEGGGNPRTTSEPLYVKLADDVLVVPVVVLNYKPHAADAAQIVYRDERRAAAGMFDFYPTYVDSASKPQSYVRWSNQGIGYPVQTVVPHRLLSPASNPWMQGNYETRSPEYDAHAPNLEETPPDEIWAQCGIQFQVVAHVDSYLPQSWRKKPDGSWFDRCNANGTNVPDPRSATVEKLSLLGAFFDERLRGLAYYVTEVLKPAYVSFVDLGACSFEGDTDTVNAIVEVDYFRKNRITSHELGHVLGLGHENVAGELMTEAAGGTKITASQCAAARAVAAGFSERFDEFNRVTGRTFSATTVPNLDDYLPKGDEDGDLGGIDDPSPYSCCLASGDATASPDPCRAGGALAKNQCESICCSNGQEWVTRYSCEKAGFVASDCQPN